MRGFPILFLGVVVGLTCAPLPGVEAGVAIIPPPCAAPDDDLCVIGKPALLTTTTLRDSPFHWFILEPTRDGKHSGDFTGAEIAQIKSGGSCRKTMLGSLSLAEASTTRDYWSPAWVNAQGSPIPGVAPAWLGPPDPARPGVYRVRYWLPEWRSVLFGAAGGASPTPLDRIIDQGFDGVCLGAIDAYAYWSSAAGGNERTRTQARRDMINLVKAVADYAHITRGSVRFLIFSRGGADVIRTDAGALDAFSELFFGALTGTLQEDLYYTGLTVNQPAQVQTLLDLLHEFVARSRFVLVTDYTMNASNSGAAANNVRIGDFHAKCRAEGFIPYAARQDRALDTIVTTGGMGWTIVQPTPGCPTYGVSGDANGDNAVDFFDLNIVLSQFGQHGPALSADLNHDGVVDFFDLNIILSGFGAACPLGV